MAVTPIIIVVAIAAVTLIATPTTIKSMIMNRKPIRTLIQMIIRITATTRTKTRMRTRMTIATPSRELICI
jgi:hypothetical protein